MSEESVPVTWNYRIIHRRCPDGLGGFDDLYDIYEVHYTQERKIWGVTADPVPPHGNSLEDLQQAFAMYQQAFTRPVLEWTEMPGTDEKDSQED